MKILHVISSISPTGGGPIEAVNQFSARMVATGDQIEVASLDAPDAPCLKQSLLPVHALGPARLSYAYSSRFVPWLRANRGRYDAVIVNGIWQFSSFGAWCALRNSSTPYFLYPHGMLDPWFKRQYPLKHLKKWMYWPWADYRVVRDAEAVIFTCEEERLLARTSFWLYRCNEVVVPLAVTGPPGDPDSEQQAFRAGFPELHGKRLALFVGRIHPKKSCDLVIQAFAKVLAQEPTSDWHLVFIGPDQIGWRSNLSALAERLGVASRITWAGFVSVPMKWGALRLAEIFFFPSHMENFGIVVSEALSAGLPTLISNQVNIWREIEADGAGLIAEDNLQGACKLLESYLALPEDRKHAMRRAARRCFEQRFEITKVTSKLQMVLSDATGVN